MNDTIDETKVVRSLSVYIRDSRPGDDVYNGVSLLVTDGRFVGKTVREMLLTLSKMPELHGGLIRSLSIANPDFRDTSLDQNLLDWGIYEEVDPNGYREYNEDTKILLLDYIHIVYAFYE